jgi:hypothetical protein
MAETLDTTAAEAIQPIIGALPGETVLIASPASAVTASEEIPQVEQAGLTTASSPTAADKMESAPAELLPPIKAAPPEGCRTLTFKAMAADVKAFTAQSQKLELAEQSGFFSEAVSLWTKAAERCEDRDRERALRNLDDSRKVLAAISEQMGSGPQCAAGHKDAGALQEMARKALGERRWDEAAMLFYKSVDMWSLAVELCSGSQRDLASRRHEESVIDGHNAEFCAPLFDRAREHTQKLRSSAAQLSREEKQQASMIAETLWREAVDKCRGNAVQDTARNNAQSLARERGTPWVASEVVVQEKKHVAVAPAILPAGKISSPAPYTKLVSDKVQESASQAPALAQGLQGKPPATPPTVASATVNVTAPSAPLAVSSPAVSQIVEFIAEDAARLTTYTGQGKVVWAGGDKYEGDLLKGQRHGKGSFAWANGMSYSGDWASDSPEGKGSLKFANGDRYEGAVHGGVPQGQGIMRYVSGDAYTGNFNAGAPDGNGSYTWKNGQRFDGRWTNGRPDGQGHTRFASGDSYTGNHSNGEPDGQGEYIWANGDKHVGQWKAGRMHGSGTYVWKNGNQWVGIYENGEQTQQGKIISKVDIVSDSAPTISSVQVPQ